MWLDAPAVFSTVESRKNGFPRRTVTAEPNNADQPVAPEEHGDLLRRSDIVRGRFQDAERARVHSTGPTSATGYFSLDVVQPLQPVGGHFGGRNSRPAGHWHRCQPPRAARVSGLEQQVEVPTCRVIRGVGVFEKGEAGHGDRVLSQFR